MNNFFTENSLSKNVIQAIGCIVEEIDGIV